MIIEKEDLFWTRMMRITIPFCTLLFLTYVAHVCLADDVSSGINEHENIWDEEDLHELPGYEMTIEERGNKNRWYTNQQIRNKFIRQYNLIHSLTLRVTAVEATGGGDTPALIARLTAAEAEIVTLKSNEAAIGDSFLVKCKNLDHLLHPDNHCCKTDFTVMCVSNLIATVLFPFSTTAQGECPSCPTGLVTG